MDYAPFRLSKKWLAPLFRGFHSSLAPTARPGSYAGKPLERKAFRGFFVHPPGGLLLSLRDNSPCAVKSDESRKGPRSSIRQRFPDKMNGAWTMLRFLFYIIFSSVFRFPGPRLPGAYPISRRESAAAGPHRSDLDFSSGSAPPAPPPWFPSYPRFWKGCRPAGRYRGWS